MKKSRSWRNWTTNWLTGPWSVCACLVAGVLDQQVLGAAAEVGGDVRDAQTEQEQIHRHDRQYRKQDQFAAEGQSHLTILTAKGAAHPLT